MWVHAGALDDGGGDAEESVGEEYDEDAEYGDGGPAVAFGFLA